MFAPSMMLRVFGYSYSTLGVDARVHREYLYFLTDYQSSPTINVFDIGDGGWPRQVQSFDVFAEMGTIPDWMGMAGWPSIS